MTKLPKGIHENLQFLCVEIDSQLASMQLYFEQEMHGIAHRVIDRAGYAYNLKTRIHSGVINRLIASDLDSLNILTLRSIEFIANDLERIAEICRNCISHTERLQSFAGIMPRHYIKLLKQIRKAVQLVMPAIDEADSKRAIEIGQVNYILEQDHNKLLKKYISALKKRKDTEQLTQALFVAYEFKQMGSALVHISESIISANLGQPVSFERYFSLQSLVADIEMSDDQLQIETIAETRSGTAVSGLSSANNGYLGIYKGGRKQKLKEEKDGVKSWHEIYPGLAPKILSYKKKGESAALLIEHLPGYTFEHIVLNDSAELLDMALKQLSITLRSIWQETQTDRVINARFMQQLQKRLPDVYSVHPEFIQGSIDICGQKLSAFDDLIKQAAELEKQWPAAFSVYIHGDFNVDNIIYDPLEKRINFIDLHRSRYMDYVQDVSIFMVSNYRLQILDAPRRKRIMDAARKMYAVARRYAVKHNDDSFELRLALGLARSFATSTRFILDKSLAREMFMRARYLIELVLATSPNKLTRFRIPLKEIFVE